MQNALLLNYDTIACLVVVVKRMITIITLVLSMSCSRKDVVTKEQKQDFRNQFKSLEHNHFEGGMLFDNIEVGLDILWEASFRKSRAYKENAGFFVSGGLLILPNSSNGHHHASICSLPIKSIEDKLFVLYRNTWLEVFGIIHTHPDIRSQRRPSPRNDYQFGYLGIHNYVMDHHTLYDAYKDELNYECFTVLGRRKEYHLIQFVEAYKNEHWNQSIAEK